MSCWTCLVLGDGQLGGGWLAAAVCASKGASAPGGATVHLIQAAMQSRTYTLSGEAQQRQETCDSHCTA